MNFCTEFLKTLNKINWDNGSGFIRYVINDEKDFCIKVNSLDTSESIVNDIIFFIQEIEKSLEKNYETIMKRNWA